MVDINLFEKNPDRFARLSGPAGVPGTFILTHGLVGLKVFLIFPPVSDERQFKSVLFPFVRRFSDLKAWTNVLGPVDTGAVYDILSGGGRKTGNAVSFYARWNRPSVSVLDGYAFSDALAEASFDLLSGAFEELGFSSRSIEGGSIKDGESVSDRTRKNASIRFFPTIMSEPLSVVRCASGEWVFPALFGSCDLHDGGEGRAAASWRRISDIEEFSVFLLRWRQELGVELMEESDMCPFFGSVVYVPAPSVSTPATLYAAFETRVLGLCGTVFAPLTAVAVGNKTSKSR